MANMSLMSSVQPASNDAIRVGNVEVTNRATVVHGDQLGNVCCETVGMFNFFLDFVQRNFCVMKLNSSDRRCSIRYRVPRYRRRVG